MDSQEEEVTIGKSDVEAAVASPSQTMQSDYENFLNTQIDALISQEREKRNGILAKTDQLSVAIDFCKQHLMHRTEEGARTADYHQRRRVVMGRLVTLKLELEQLRESKTTGKKQEEVKKVKGHNFTAQSSSGRNPYCEVCLSTIWRFAQEWRKCSVCGLRLHDKCIAELQRECVSVLLAQPDFSLALRLVDEATLPQQSWQCHECHAPIGFDEEAGAEPRFCHYTSRYYCARCHWNDEWVIPARLVRNWDAYPRPVCRASKQLLSCVQSKPLIDVWAENAALFKYVGALGRMKELREAIMLMKSYFVSCRRARKLRILQYLSRYQHFVETATLYSLEDLAQLADGKLLPDIETIVCIFRQHITEECEICKGNAFICELCSSNEAIYPFSLGVSMCGKCNAAFHSPCFDLASKRCPRCARRRLRRTGDGSANPAEEKISDGSQASLARVT